MLVYQVPDFVTTGNQTLYPLVLCTCHHTSTSPILRSWNREKIFINRLGRVIFNVCYNSLMDIKSFLNYLTENNTVMELLRFGVPS